VIRIPPTNATQSAAADGVRDHTGALQRWFTDRAMQVTLVRPDRYVFGGGTLAGLPALMQQLLIRLLSPSQLSA
jgi:hypothetical protein